MRPWRWPLPFASAGAKIPAPGMGLLIDTAVVPARERLDFWWEESCDAYPPAPDPERGPGAVLRPDVGLRARPAELLPDRRGTEHDAADVAGDRGLRPRVPACLGDPERAARRCAGGPLRRRPSGRHGQLRDVAPGDRPSGEALRGAGDEGAAPPAGPRGGADQQAHRAQDSGQRRDHESSGGLPARVVQRPRGRLDHSGGHACGRGLHPRPRPGAPRRADMRARADHAAVARRDPAQHQVLHRGEPRQPGPRAPSRSHDGASSRRGTCTSSSRPRG